MNPFAWRQSESRVFTADPDFLRLGRMCRALNRRLPKPRVKTHSGHALLCEMHLIDPFERHHLLKKSLSELFPGPLNPPVLSEPDNICGTQGILDSANRMTVAALRVAFSHHLGQAFLSNMLEGVRLICIPPKHAPDRVRFAWIGARHNRRLVMIVHRVGENERFNPIQFGKDVNRRLIMAVVEHTTTDGEVYAHQIRQTFAHQRYLFGLDPKESHERGKLVSDQALDERAEKEFLRVAGNYLSTNLGAELPDPPMMNANCLDFGQRADALQCHTEFDRYLLVVRAMRLIEASLGVDYRLDLF